jgi:DNA-directed RNA polymerase specialized sigma24 family protein
MPPNETHDSSPFPLTRWSLVGRAAGAGGDMRVRAAVNELVVRYLPALRAHLVLTRRLSPDDADDLLQNFMASKVLEQNLFSRADEAQGKFRTFLLAALGNYLIDHVRAAQAKKRSVGKDAMQIDEQRSEVIDPRVDQPSAAFDAAWARQVLDRATHLMRQQCEAEGRADVWGVFQSRVLLPALEGAEPAAYDELVKQFELASPDQASNVLVTGKRMFARCLRDAVAEYVDDDEIEQELRELKALIARGTR